MDNATLKEINDLKARLSGVEQSEAPSIDVEAIVSACIERLTDKLNTDVTEQLAPLKSQLNALGKRLDETSESVDAKIPKDIKALGASVSAISKELALLDKRLEKTAAEIASKRGKPSAELKELRGAVFKELDKLNKQINRG